MISHGPFSENNSRRRPTLPHTCARSTIGAGGLNCRVRNGNGCFPPATVTGKSKLRKNQAVARLRNRIGLEAMGFAVEESGIIGQAGRPISTGKLNALQRLHLLPINLVIFQGSSGRPHLGGGFPLRCFQRLSFPNIATQRCRWRDNWCTRGSSIPVLSY